MGEMMQYRATTMSKKGMVTTPHYYASQAALKVLERGGNAVEAAIAAASTIGVVYPHMNGIGGDNFWLIYNASADELKGLNASGRAGQQATMEFYKEKGYQTIPTRGPLAAVTVPGAVAGWGDAYAYSQQQMQGATPWQDLLEDAIRFADEGFPVTRSQWYWTTVNMDTSDETFRYLQRFNEFSKSFLNENAQVYKEGEIFTQPDLAATLRLIATRGANYYYNSELTDRIVGDLQKHGGLLTKEDFVQHMSDWVDPISVNYRGYQAYNLPPNTQGFASLSILNILNHIDLSKVEEGSSEYYHILVEAIKCAFKDRDQYLTDPTFSHIPLDRLLSSERGRRFAECISWQRTSGSLKPLDPKGDTIWFGIVDQYGNAVSFIQSIYHEFGSGFIPEGTGIVLQNRGSFFSLDEKHVNCLQPKKRTFHTLNPAMLFKEGKPQLVYGTMGGEGQPQTQTAIVTRIIDYGYNVQVAIEAPRWLYGRTWGASSNSLKLENRIPDNVRQELQALGHEIEVLPGLTDVMGHAGAIWIDVDTNVKFGGTDPRSDGLAIGH